MTTGTTARSLMEGLLEHLRAVARGRESAVPLAELAQWFGVDWRTVAKGIELLRERGYPIGTARAKPYGAFWPVTDEDYEAALRPFFAAASRMMQVYWRLMKRVPGQVLEKIGAEKQMELFEASKCSTVQGLKAKRAGPFALKQSKTTVEAEGPGPRRGRT